MRCDLAATSTRRFALRTAARIRYKKVYYGSIRQLLPPLPQWVGLACLVMGVAQLFL